MLGSECMSSASAVSALNNQARPSAPGCDHFLFACVYVWESLYKDHVQPQVVLSFLVRVGQ